MSSLDEILQANERYAADFGANSELTLPAKRGFAILTCQDARLIPPKFAGFAEGEAVVVRNAGGRATDDAIRSLAISHKLLGTTEWFVIQHDDCGMALVTEAEMRDMFTNSLEPTVFKDGGFREVGIGPGSTEAEYINWLTISDSALSVVSDVTRIRNHPLVSAKISIYGYLYDIRTGRLNEVPDATIAGKAR
ncbi:beta-class carbonic anhydrase [Jatrophihabitans sp.]|jgi:carbonic anhydrase|uniref:beta-class carbonic anhydrase n=1 Tax=Jatrophihabitans sp. TaxID=1932789 RepID=UPI002F0BFA75